MAQELCLSRVDRQIHGTLTSTQKVGEKDRGWCVECFIPDSEGLL